MKRVYRLSILAVLLVVVLTIGSIGFAKDKGAYPSQPIQFIVPYAPGGSSDVQARAIAKFWTKYSSQPLVVVNKPGGGGVIGTEYVVRAKPDGYTIMFAYGSGSEIVMPHLQKMPYDPLNDLAIVCRMSIHPVCVVTRKESEFNSLTELIDWAKKNNQPITAAASTKYGACDIALAAIGTVTGVKMTIVPFKGSAESITAVVGGHTMIGAGHPADIASQLRSGNLKPLAIALDQRSPSVPTVPTLLEQGINLVTWGSVKGVAAPKKTPSKIIKYLETTMKKVSDDPEYQKTCDEIACSNDYLNSKEYTAFIKKASRDYAKLIQKLKAMGY